MKKALTTLVVTTIFATGLFLTTSKASAETLFGDYLADKGLEIEVSASVDMYSKYVWRGFLLDDDPIVQPAVTISSGIFEGGFWGSWDVTNDDTLKSDEVDGWLGVAFDLGFIDEDYVFIGVTAGHTWYAFPEGDTGLADGSHAEEFYIGLSLDTFLSPYFTWYGDYSDEGSGGADGNYYMFGIGHSFTLSEDYGITLDVGQEIGLNNEAFIVGDGGYSLTTVGMTLPLSDNVTLAPMIAYSAPFGDLEDSSDGNQDDEFYAGASLGFSF
jgi:hypothetical protein